MARIEETADPAADPGAIVWLQMRLDCRGDEVWVALTLGFDQRSRKGAGEFRMELEGDGVPVVQSGIRSERAACDDPSIGRQCDDLILVRCGRRAGAGDDISPRKPRLIPAVDAREHRRPQRNGNRAAHGPYCCMTRISPRAPQESHRRVGCRLSWRPGESLLERSGTTQESRLAPNYFTLHLRRCPEPTLSPAKGVGVEFAVLQGLVGSRGGPDVFRSLRKLNSNRR